MCAARLRRGKDKGKKGKNNNAGYHYHLAVMDLSTYILSKHTCVQKSINNNCRARKNTTQLSQTTNLRSAEIGFT